MTRQGAGPRAAAWALVAAVVVAAPPSPLAAHPHVWATVEVDVVYGADQRVAELRQRWTFDEYYSAFASQGLDADGDGVYSREELQPLADENIESLKDFDYFTFLKVDEESARLLAPKDAFLEHNDGLLTLHFTMPLETPIDARLGQVSFSIYDPSYFIAFDYAKTEPVRLAEGAPAGCRPDLGRSEAEAALAESRAKTLSEAFFEALGPGSDFGSQFAQSVTIDCRAR